MDNAMMNKMICEIAEKYNFTRNDREVADSFVQDVLHKRHISVYFDLSNELEAVIERLKFELPEDDLDIVTTGTLTENLTSNVEYIQLIRLLDRKQERLNQIITALLWRLAQRKEDIFKEKYHYDR